jgi:uncharacterized protein (DUF1015 family)
VSAFEPFHGIRYDTARVSLAQVVAPPYDVVSESRRAALAATHSCSVVVVDMPRGAEGSDPYAAAAATFEGWLGDGTLTVDPEPSLYIYRMDYLDELGAAAHTVGVIGSLELRRPDEGKVLPHEHTTPKAKTDRLQLLRATGTNLSPIWGLSPTGGLTTLLHDDGLTPVGEWTASDGTRHRVWRVTDRDRLAAIGAAVDASPVLIADGHHRYETSLQHRDEQRAANDGRPGPYDRVMAFVVELDPRELHVLPIHRLIAGLPDDLDLPAAFARSFVVRADDGPLETLPARMVQHGSLALVTGQGRWLLEPRAEAMVGVRDLDSSRLDRALEALPPHELRYQHGVEHIADAVRDGEADAGVLLRPVPLPQIEAIAHGGERMPPKSTYFHPKPSTGAVFMRVR